MLITAFLTLAAVGPVFADTVSRDTDSTQGASVPTTGTKLSMYRGFNLGSCSFNPPVDPNIAPGATTFPANTPFFVRHGWVDFPTTPVSNQTLAAFQRPSTDFELYVDHVEQQSLPDFFVQNGVHIKLFVINFPSGMTGTHLFQGWWFQDGYFTGGAANTQVIELACNLQITFN